MILGLGLDLVSLPRMERSLERFGDRLLERGQPLGFGKDLVGDGGDINFIGFAPASADGRDLANRGIEKCE